LLAQDPVPSHEDVLGFYTETQLQTCEVPAVVEGTSIVLTSNTTASVEVIFDQGVSAAIALSVYATDDLGVDYYPTNTAFNIWNFYPVDRGRRLTIYASIDEECDNPPSVTTIDVECSRASLINVRQEVLNAITEWDGENEHPSLAPYLNSIITGVTEHESWALYQAWALSCDPVDVGLLSSDIVPGYGGETRDDLCNCVTLGAQVSANFTTESGTTWLPNYRQPNAPNPGESEVDFWRNRADQGPARWDNIYTQGWKSPYGRAFTYQIGNDGGDDLTSIARLDLRLSCMNSEQYPEQCACERVAELNFEYSSNFLMASNLLGSNNTRRAGAYVEDIVFAGEFDQNGIGEIYATDAVRRSQECNLTLNTAAFAQSASTFTTRAIGVATAAAGGTVPSAAQFTQFIQSAGDLFTTPVWLQNEDCVQESIQGGASITGSRPVTFQPNETKRIFLGTSSMLRSQGMRKWYSHVGIVSDFRLSLYVPDQTDEHFDYCCSPNIYFYALGGIVGSPNSEAFHQSVAQSELDGYLFNHGHTVDDNTGVIDTPSDDETCNDIEILSLVLDQKPVQYNVFDLSGRQISAWSQLPTSSIDLQDGMYFVVGLDENQVSVEKYRILVTNGNFSKVEIPIRR